MLGVWLAAVACAAIWIAPADPTPGETTDLLPSDTPVHRGLDQLARYFGEKSGLSAVVVVFERTETPLSANDLHAIESVAAKLGQAQSGEDLHDELSSICVQSPAALALAGKANPLISNDGHAALITISLPYNYITKQAARFVKHAQGVVGQFPLPPGLSAAVTGSAGYGYDYAIATERSHRKTLIVTLISVILILLWVYRSPVVAMIPLVGISIAALIVFRLLACGDRLGLHSGTAEQIFTFVLLYGAGVDYSLLFISRYREFLDQRHSSAEAIARALDASVVAIGWSAAMTASGLAMFCLARFSVFRHAGPGVVLAVLVAAVASITLVPALLAIVGPNAFWPAKHSSLNPPKPRVWPVIADWVVARPGLVMCLTLAVLALPAIRGLHIDWNYDALFSLKSSYQARRGTEIVERHWPTREIAPVTVVAVVSHPQPPAVWLAACRRMMQDLGHTPTVGNIRGLSAPLGQHVSDGQNATVLLLAGDKVRAEFVGSDAQAMRLSVVLNVPPLSRQALDDGSIISAAAQRATLQSGLDAQIYLTGATAEMIDTRVITQQDFYRIAGMALIAILLVVTLVLRDIPLCLFILSATVLSYLTTLGLTCWVFQWLGGTGLEWKVQMLLFIVLVAVGQDYSIFFVVRFAQENRQLPCRAATRQALIFTGPVISSCGLIMAATLGSVAAGDVKLLVQLGFAFALGMLIDTFLVRPLLLPAFIILTNRTLKNVAALAG